MSKHLLAPWSRRTLLGRRRQQRSAVISVGVGLLTATCKQDPPAPPPPTAQALIIKSVNTGAMVAEQLRAAIEMQHAGEPLAEAMGRDLAGYDRQAIIPDQYQPKGAAATTDVVGYSSAVESYEYSKLAMNSVSFESGAGLSLMYGPVVNPAKVAGAPALTLLRTRIEALAVASRAGVTGTMGPWVVVPAPTANPLNPLGFPGLWPQMAEFASYDQAIAPSGNAVRGCSLSSGYGASAGTVVLVGDYECGYNSLHINRDAAPKVLAMDALGLAAWKQGLWVINYFQFVHDPAGTPLTDIAAADLPMVGKPGNTVQASTGSPPQPGTPGTYIGSSDLEGFQGMLMAEEIDNKAALLLGQLTSADGLQLGGFASLKAALDYDYQSPLRYFPHAVSVTEQPGTGGADPQPTALAIMTAESRLPDYTALLGGYAEMFALTDRANSGVGGAATVIPVFDGDPFPQDNGLPDGEATPHDRALGVLKVALINLDRLHADPATGVLVDSAQVSGGTVSRGSHVTTVELAYALVSLRNAYRALTSQLTLYSNSTPDTNVPSTALDATSLRGVPGGGTLAARLAALIKLQADFLASKLVDADGLAVNGYDLAAAKADAEPTSLEAQAAVVRGLLEAYLATSNTAYRNLAQTAYLALDQKFYNLQLRVYRPQLNEDTTFTFTPGRYAALQAALREMYNLVALRPDQKALRADLEARLGRLRKLVLNGWDDRNSDDKVDYPGECMQVRAGLPRGGLQLAERALTGELGIEKGAPTSDRDRDCVPEIDDALLPATLGATVVIVRQP